jgi:hypothetical protein
MYCEELICDYHISILSEYKTGINEFSFVGVELTNLASIIKELLSLLNANPKTRLKCTESSQVFYKILETSLDKHTYEKISEFKFVK